MNSSIKQIALYGAGREAKKAFDSLNNSEYFPVCFTDIDSDKQGKTLCGIPILSLNQALNRFPNCLFYITVANDDLKKDIVINSLLQNGIDLERIVNFEYEYKTSCRMIEAACFYVEGGLTLCCRPNKNNIHSTVNDFFISGNQSDSQTIGQYLLLRKERINVIKNGIPNPCDGCDMLSEGWFKRNQKITTLSIGSFNPCNLKCVYCGYNNVAFSEWQKTFPHRQSQNANLEEFVKQTSNFDDFEKKIAINYASGEITINPTKNDVYRSYHLIQKGQILTNAVIYDKEIEKLLKFPEISLNISIDSGTRDTYKRIKGRDYFDIVYDNIKKYNETGNVSIKYIFHELNTNEEDVLAFANICDEIKPSKVIISRDLNSKSIMSDMELGLISTLVSHLRLNNIKVFISYDYFPKSQVDTLMDTTKNIPAKIKIADMVES